MTPARSRTLRRVLLILAIVAVVTAGYAAWHVGDFLAREDPLAPADAIVVLAGRRIERPLEAGELYRAGYAPVIVVTRHQDDGRNADLEQRGVRIPNDFELSLEILRQMGVPESAVIGPPRIHDNTAEEAETLRALATQHGWQRVIVVTSKYHLRRAGMATRRALRGAHVEVAMRGTRFDPSTPGRWWQRRSDIRWLASEVPKLVAYALGFGS